MKEIARNLRSNMTHPEQILWGCIRRKKILGVQFYRQRVMGSYIVDFYAPKIRLVIELDGAQHDEPEHQSQDQYRDMHLGSIKITVMRISNREIKTQLDEVLYKINTLVEYLLSQHAKVI